jgi:hypothetical protein
MNNDWEKELSCASLCPRCQNSIGDKEPRILSVFDHQPICVSCRRQEEKRPDFADQSKQMIAECIAQTGKPYGDTASYCFHHFCPYTCRRSA